MIPMKNMSKKTLIIFLFLVTVVSDFISAEETQPEIISVEVVQSIVDINYDLNTDGIVDIYDIVLTAKNNPDYIVEVAKHYGEKKINTNE